MSENTINVKPKGLLIPEPIVIAMINMGSKDIGKVVYYMISWLYEGVHHTYGYDSMTDGARFVTEIWKEMVREDSDAG